MKLCTGRNSAGAVQLLFLESYGSLLSCEIGYSSVVEFSGSRAPSFEK
jgi:hypothetical protein